MKHLYRLLKLYVLSALLLFAGIPVGAAQFWLESSEINLHFDISSSLQIMPRDDAYYLEYVMANATFFPRQTAGQSILQLQTKPPAKISDEALTFQWNEPSAKQLSYTISSDVRRVNRMVGVDAKIPFPISNLPADMAGYTQSSPTIDSDDIRIRRLGAWIVQGEDDLFIAVHKIAEWTKNNIDYNLSTLTADVSQKASWVLENRQGVCDELTSLFIALLRSVGIPARFVSGIAYTDSPLFSENWGSHGWAEVYFPEVGWVPYDVTYGQFGFVDPAHVVFKYSIDPKDPSAVYSWRGRSVDILTQKLDVATKLVGHTGRVDDGIVLEVSVFQEHITSDSYNLLEITVENSMDYYQSRELYLSTPPEVLIDSGKHKTVVLGPRQKKTLYVPLKISGQLLPNYQYTMPVVIQSAYRKNVSTSFLVSTIGKKVSRAQVYELAADKEEEQIKTYSANLLMNCTTERSAFYVYENATVQCTIKNAGNVYLEKLAVCLQKDCTNLELGISQSEDVSFLLPKTVGKNTITLGAKNSLVTKSFSVDYEILDVPLVQIANRSVPAGVHFDDTFKLEFILAKKSQSDIYNAEVEISLGKKAQTLSLSKITADTPVSIELSGNQLRQGVNTIAVTVGYEDANGRQYTTDSSFEVALVEVTLWQKIQLWLYRVNDWIAGIFE